MEEALHDMALFRDFAGLGGWDERVPDESTILRFSETYGFRRMLEKHKLAPQVLQTINELLQAKFALSNLWMVRRKLGAVQASVRPQATRRSQ